MIDATMATSEQAPMIVVELIMDGNKHALIMINKDTGQIAIAPASGLVIRDTASDDDTRHFDVVPQKPKRRKRAGAASR